MTLRNKIIKFLAYSDEFNSISDIAKKLECAYSHAHKFVMELSKEGVIKIQKVGNVSVCKLNINEGITLAYLSMISHVAGKKWREKNPQSEKILEKINTVKDKVHCVLVKGSKVIIITEFDGNFGMFRNRTVINVQQLRKNIEYYKDAVVLYGAECYWGLLCD